MCHIPFCLYVAKAATKFRRSMKCVVLTECVNVSITLNGHVLYLNKGMNYWCTHTDMQFWILNTGFKLGTSCHVLLISLQSCQMLETFVCFHVPQCMIFNPNVWIGLLWGRSSSLACAMPVNHKEKDISGQKRAHRGLTLECTDDWSGYEVGCSVPVSTDFYCYYFVYVFAWGQI